MCFPEKPHEEFDYNGGYKVKQCIRRLAEFPVGNKSIVGLQTGCWKHRGVQHLEQVAASTRGCPTARVGKLTPDIHKLIVTHTGGQVWGNATESSSSILRNGDMHGRG